MCSAYVWPRLVQGQGKKLTLFPMLHMGYSSPSVIALVYEFTLLYKKNWFHPVTYGGRHDCFCFRKHPSSLTLLLWFNCNIVFIDFLHPLQDALCMRIGETDSLQVAVWMFTDWLFVFVCSDSSVNDYWLVYCLCRSLQCECLLTGLLFLFAVSNCKWLLTGLLFVSQSAVWMFTDWFIVCVAVCSVNVYWLVYCLCLQSAVSVLWEDFPRQNCAEGTHEEKTAPKNQPKKHTLWQVLHYQLPGGHFLIFLIII